MARHRLTIGVGDEHFTLLQEIGEVSSRRAGDVAKDMVVEILDGLLDMYKNCEGHTTESARRKILRVGLNKMMDALEADETK